MAKSSSIIPIALVSAIAAGGIYAFKRGMFRNMMRQQVRTSEAELKLRLTGFHGTNDGAVYANIEALNPSSYPLQVKSIIGKFIVNGRIVGTATMFGDQVVRPADKATLPVEVRVMPQAVTMFRQRGSVVQFRGNINLNNIVQKLSMDYTI